MARLIFRNFWSFIALTAALSEWLLWCWFAGAPAGVAAHVSAIGLLAVFNRLAAAALEHERHRRPLARALGMAALALGFGSFVATGFLVALVVCWMGIGAFVAGPAAAGGVAALPLVEPGIRFAGGLGATAGALVMLHGYWRGHRKLIIERRTLSFPALPPALAGLRLVHLSDLHVGPLTDRHALAHALACVNALEADVICVTGDVVDSRKTEIAAWLPLLATLRARFGVFAILGNHDRESGAERVATALTDGTDWQLLRDTMAVVEVDGARLHLLGLEDRPRVSLTEQLPNLLARVPPGDFAVLLAHHPDAFDEAAAAAVPLTLAGHTHGGQLAVPGLPQLNVARLLISPRSIGWFRQDGQYLHVSTGLGVSGQRVRVCVPCEITEITLAGADVSSNDPTVVQ